MKGKILFKIAGLFMLISICNQVLAKDKQQSKARMRLEYLNTGVEQRSLTVVVKSKVEKRYQPVEGVAINLFLLETSESGFIGKVVTDENGKGTLLLPNKFYLMLDTINEFKFIASLEDNPEYFAKEVELNITEVMLDIDFIDQDSLKLLRAIVREKDSLGTRPPAKEVEIKFLVERPFSRLPVGGEYNATDDEGMATIDFPLDLPGDSAGNITVIIKIEDSDLYGTVEKIGVINWGIPTVFDDQTAKRSLWSAGANAPIPLLLLVNSLILGVWGTIIFIVVKVFQIRSSE